MSYNISSVLPFYFILTQTKISGIRLPLRTCSQVYYLKRKNKTTTKPLRTGIAQNTELINAGQQKLDGKKFIELRGEHNHDIATGTPDARLVLKNIRFERI